MYYNRSLDKLMAASIPRTGSRSSFNTRCPWGAASSSGVTCPRSWTAVVGGWEVSCIANYSSGTPLGFSGASSINGWNGGTPGSTSSRAIRGCPAGRAAKFDYANRLSNPASQQVLQYVAGQRAAVADVGIRPLRASPTFAVGGAKTKTWVAKGVSVQGKICPPRCARIF